MTTPVEIIHVDFKTRRRVSAHQADVDTLKAIVAEAASTTAVALDRFLEPAVHVYGCDYESTKTVPLKDIGKVIRAYVKNTYPLVKFRVRTEHKSVSVQVVDPGPVAVYAPTGPGYSSAMREILRDIEAFANRFNYDKSDIMTDYFDTRFYLHTGVDWTVTTAAKS